MPTSAFSVTLGVNLLIYKCASTEPERFGYNTYQALNDQIRYTSTYGGETMYLTKLSP